MSGLTISGIRDTVTITDRQEGEMMTDRITMVAAALLTLVVGAGCGPATSADPSPTAVTTPAATVASPTASPTPTVTFAQAESTYRALVEAKYQAQKSGGISPDSPMPAAITQRAEGQALADYRDVITQVFNKGGRWVSGTYKITGVALSHDQSKPDAQIALVGCEDWRDVKSSWPDGAGNGLLVKTTSWYHIAKDGSVKQIAYDTNKAASCDVK